MLKQPTSASAALPERGVARLPLAVLLLHIGVPLYITQLQERDDTTFWTRFREWTSEQAMEEAGVFSEVLPAGGGKPGDAARAFHALARCLAALAFVPGGVSFGGAEWISERTASENPATASAEVEA